MSVTIGTIEVDPRYGRAQVKMTALFESGPIFDQVRMLEQAVGEMVETHHYAVDVWADQAKAERKKARAAEMRARAEQRRLNEAL